MHGIQSLFVTARLPFFHRLGILLYILLLLGCGSGNSSSGSPSSGTNSPGTNPPDSSQSLSAKEKLTSFGFGQAILINKPTATARADVALSMPAFSSRTTAMSYFAPNAAIGNVAVGYTTVPHTIDASSMLSGGFGSTVGNINDYLTAAGTALIDPSDLSSIFQNNANCRFLNLGQHGTKDKMASLLNQILKDVPTASGFFIDHIEPIANFSVPFSYPEELHSVIVSFKAVRMSQGKEEPVMIGNFFSLNQHSGNGYKVYNPNAFDAVLVEEYGVKSGSDKVPADIIEFHKSFPKAIIIVNTVVNDPTHPTMNEQLRAREAVTIAALVSGLHAIDRGSSDHGDNAYARQFLNFPILRPGKPTSAMVDTIEYYRRDYAAMIAIIAKQNSTISLQPGTWHDYWDSSGQGAPFSGSINLIAGRSYLLFKDK